MLAVARVTVLVCAALKKTLHLGVIAKQVMYNVSLDCHTQYVPTLKSRTVGSSPLIGMILLRSGVRHKSSISSVSCLRIALNLWRCTLASVNPQAQAIKAIQPNTIKSVAITRSALGT